MSQDLIDRVRAAWENDPITIDVIVHLWPDMARALLSMEAERKAADDLEIIAAAMAERQSLYSGHTDDSLVNQAKKALAAYRKAREAAE